MCLRIVYIVFLLSVIADYISNETTYGRNDQGPKVEPIPAYTSIVFCEQNHVFAIHSSGQIIAGTPQGHSIADVIQQAIDRCSQGGEVRITAGEYRLDKSVVVDYPCTISGEGRGTILVPPVNDFALRMERIQRSPGLSDWVWGTKRDKIPPWLYDLCAERLYGVHILFLAIIGYGQGKGIFFNGLTECCFESEFQNIPCYNNGSIKNKEATLVIASQEKGDSNNNLHFDKLYILLPDYMGVQIGSESGKYPPRLRYLERVCSRSDHEI